MFFLLLFDFTLISILTFNLWKIESLKDWKFWYLVKLLLHEIQTRLLLKRLFSWCLLISSFDKNLQILADSTGFGFEIMPTLQSYFISCYTTIYLRTVHSCFSDTFGLCKKLSLNRKIRFRFQNRAPLIDF